MLGNWNWKSKDGCAMSWQVGRRPFSKLGVTANDVAAAARGQEDRSHGSGIKTQDLEITRLK